MKHKEKIILNTNGNKNTLKANKILIPIILLISLFQSLCILLFMIQIWHSLTTTSGECSNLGALGRQFQANGIAVLDAAGFGLARELGRILQRVGLGVARVEAAPYLVIGGVALAVVGLGPDIVLRRAAPARACCAAGWCR